MHSTLKCEHRVIANLLTQVEKLKTPSQPTRAISTMMPTVGVLTGISYVSGVDYYQGINEKVANLMPQGKFMKKNPPMVMVSVDCDEYVTFLENRDDEGVIDYLFVGVQKLVAAGVDFLVIASNTGHCVVPRVEKELGSLPILHIADCTALAIKDRGLTKVGLLGTEPTMRDGSWLKSRLAAHGVTVSTPDEPDVLRRCYDIICQELSFDVFKPESAQFFIEQIKAFHAAGCQGVILGCTEIELLVTEELAQSCPIPIFRSAAIHIEAAAQVLSSKRSTAEFLPPAK